MSQVLDLTAHTSLSPIRRGFAPSFVNYKKGSTRLTAASDKVYQLLAQGRWFSPGTPASSTTKTGRHDIAEVLLKVALKHQKSNQNQIRFMTYYLSLQNFFLLTSAIDFNVVNPSNNTFNRQKIIIAIFVNETKGIFERKEKNTKKHSKNDSRLHSMFYNMPRKTYQSYQILPSNEEEYLQNRHFLWCC